MPIASNRRSSSWESRPAMASATIGMVQDRASIWSGRVCSLGSAFSASSPSRSQSAAHWPSVTAPTNICRPSAVSKMS